MKKRKWPWSKEVEIPPAPPQRKVVVTDAQQKKVKEATEDIRKRLLDIEAEILGDM